jgi:glycosyltransferase involved in cell wall biosynthesis
MRLLAINQYYAPDHAATAQLLSDLCEGVAAQGDDVCVIASSGSYLGGGRLPPRENIRGVAVRRPWATNLGKRHVVHRVADYGTFWSAAVLDALRVERPDVMLALTTPPMIAAGALLAAKARGVPVVSWVQDVYPEVAAEFGVLRRSSAAYRTFALLARRTHGAMERIVVLSERMAERVIAQGASPEQVRVIPNWADGSLVMPLSHAENPFRLRHGLTDRFVALYSGNLGVGHDFETFIDAARSLASSRPEVLFLFVGDGARRAETEAKSRGLANVRFLPYQPRETLAESLSAADLHLISLRDGLDGLLVPSKLYGALASGRPVFFVGPQGCEVSRVIRRFDLGWSGCPGDTQGLVRAIEHAVVHREDTARRGEEARRIFAEHFERRHAVAKFRAVLDEIVRR